MAKSKPERWAKAIAHLRSLDDAWADLIDKVGPCPIVPRPDHFSILVRAIIGQQISSKAAASIDARLRTLGGDPHAPGPLLALGEEGLRSVGLSGVKARYVLNLSGAVESGSLPLQEIDKLDDDAIIKHLTAIKGVGVWTAEMFLMFALARPDILPVGDLGVRAALKNRFALDEMPDATLCRSLTETWRPYRTVASWYLWRSLEFAKVDQADKEPPSILIPTPKKRDSKAKTTTKSKANAKVKAKSKAGKPK